ncbi:SDR family oxidoreductase [Kitasatospora sp. NPDC096077]|uniref:SDR family oxidoreductase n=1 Tax=Kitasatospora sp. NPDC096077 TaxID=3155544 RepID=UPI00331B0219
MPKLTDRTALVTGASRGIGRAIAERLAREGALVAVHYGTSAEAAEQVVAGIRAEGGRAFAVQAELGPAKGVDTLFASLEAQLKEHTGDTRLDILVNNAGIMGTALPGEITDEWFDRMMTVNAKAPLFVTQRALGLIPDHGRIINISSGLTRFAAPEQLTYAMTKGALEQVTLHLARHLGQRRITVNTVAPGSTDNGSEVFQNPEIRAVMSQFSTFGDVAEPAAIADVVAFLASEDARWITGAFVDTSGGTLLG